MGLPLSELWVYPSTPLLYLLLLCLGNNEGGGGKEAITVLHVCEKSALIAIFAISHVLNLPPGIGLTIKLSYFTKSKLKL